MLFISPVHCDWGFTSWLSSKIHIHKRFFATFPETIHSTIFLLCPIPCFHIISSLIVFVFQSNENLLLTFSHQKTNPSIELNHNKTKQDYAYTAECPSSSSSISLCLWQVGQSRLQSKVLSFPQPSFPAGLGKVLFHSMTVQCKMELYFSWVHQTTS